MNYISLPILDAGIPSINQLNQVTNQKIYINYT